MKEQLRPARTRKREYNATVKRAEQELAAVLKAYAEAQQAYTNAHETNMILAEMLDMQECMAAVYQKHLRWMAAGGPTEAWPEQEAVLLADDRPSWVMFLLETATWEQQQRALSMSTDDWMLYHRQFIADLQELMEINSKCPDVQVGVCVCECVG
jgi:hypothetical protein